MKRDLIFRVEPAEGGLRLDRFLAERMPEIPPRSFRVAFAAGEVRLNGGRAAKGARVKQGDVVAVVRVAEEGDWLPAAGSVPGARLLYADDCVAVLFKPAGVHTEAQRPGEEGTLAGLLLHLFPGVAAFAPGPGLSLLSRLDRDTSGAVPAALTAEALCALRGQQAAGALVKTYLCLVRGTVAGELVLAARIESRGGPRVKVKRGEREDDPSRWTVVRPVEARGGRTLVRAVIARGRRHQIRAHLSAAGFPIVGDLLYGPPNGGLVKEPLALHCEAVEFSHPRTGGKIRVGAPPPAGFGEPSEPPLT